MTKEEKIKLLTEWELRLCGLHLHFDALVKVIGMIDGPFSESIWRVTTAYTKAVALAVGDVDEWCDWYESHFILSLNVSAEVVLANGETRIVKSIADLVEVLEFDSHEKV